MLKCKKTIISGALTLHNIGLIEQYYGNAIRACKGDLKAMTDACWAVFYHSASTDENPQHQYCSVSWCKHLQAETTGDGPQPHNTTIPPDFIPFVKPIFEDLCKKELLKKCLLGATQNRNESFNALVWARAPKTEFTTMPTIQIATGLACIVFNSGNKSLTKVMEKLQLQPGPLCTAHLAGRDDFRTKRSLAKEAEVAKQRKKSKRIEEVRVEEAHIEEEGPTYGRGAF